MKDVALWFGLVQVDNWDHDLAVQNLFLQKNPASQKPKTGLRL